MGHSGDSTHSLCQMMDQVVVYFMGMVSLPPGKKQFGGILFMAY
jgi:hypothetical protein